MEYYTRVLPANEPESIDPDGPANRLKRGTTYDGIRTRTGHALRLKYQRVHLSTAVAKRHQCPQLPKASLRKGSKVQCSEA